MNKTDVQVLRACEASCNMGLAYHPGKPLAGNAGRMVALGLMTRNAGITGGFRISEHGREKIRALDNARLLQKLETH